MESLQQLQTILDQTFIGISMQRIFAAFVLLFLALL